MAAPAARPERREGFTALQLAGIACGHCGQRLGDGWRRWRTITLPPVLPCFQPATCLLYLCPPCHRDIRPPAAANLPRWPPPPQTVSGAIACDNTPDTIRRVLAALRRLPDAPP